MGLFGGKKKAEPQESFEEERTAEASTSGQSASKETDDKIADELLSEVVGETTPKKKKKSKEKKLELTTSVFEFGSAGGNKGLTLAGFCPISDEHEPCKWEVIEDGGPDQPATRIIF